MKKKFAAMFMAAAMVFTMAACGQKPTPRHPSTDGSGDQSGAEAQTLCLAPAVRVTGGYAITVDGRRQRRGRLRTEEDQRRRDSSVPNVTTFL